jgi:hypothetical protein
MVSDSLECPRTEFGPYFSREGAELAAVRLGVRYLLRYEYETGYRPEITTSRVSAIRVSTDARVDLLTRCATCGVTARHRQRWEADVWADIHEFENRKHAVRLFLKTDHTLVEVPNWRAIGLDQPQP